MDYEEFREGMNRSRLTFVHEAAGMKEMNLVWIKLGKLRSRFDDHERSMAERVLREWLESEDVGMRSDAEFLITEFKLHETEGYLRRLADRLASLPAPTVPEKWEMKKIQGLLTMFGSRRLTAP
jgi:hypothetical protein